MKTSFAHHKLYISCCLCLILLLLSCKITDSISNTVDSVFGHEPTESQGEQATNPDTSPQSEDPSDDGELSMDPIEEMITSNIPLWEPVTEPVLSTPLTADTTTWLEIDQYASIMIPPSDLSNDPVQLEVSKVTNEITSPLPNMEFLDAYDVTLEDIHALQYPMAFSMKYDPAILDPNIPAASQIGMALYDQASGRWTALETEIDDINYFITAQIDHLSILTIYLHKQQTNYCKTPHFMISYNRDNIINATGNMSYTPTRNSCENSPLFINAVADNLEWAYEGYNAAGFSMENTDIPVNVADLSGSYIWGTESQLDTLSGELIIGTMSWGYPDDLRQDCAHELFHYWQYHNISLYTYLSNQWWMDATADYAADQVAYASSSLGPTNAMGQDIKEDYLNDSLTSTKGTHAYSTAHFIDYLIANSGGYASLHDLWVTSVASSSAIDDLKASFAAHLYDPFADVYRDFADYMLFDANSALPLGDTVWDTKAVKDKIVYSADMGELSALAYVKPYASIMYGLRVDEAQFMFLDWTNKTEGVVYVFTDSDEDQRTGSRFWKQLFATKKALFPMDPEDTIYILMINPTGSELEFDLKYGASAVSAYTVNFNFGGSDECIENSNWGSSLIFMELNNGQATLHYDSKTDDYYWSAGAEHTITASGQGTYDKTQLNGTVASTDTLPLGVDKDDNQVIGTISVNAAFNLTASTDMPFVWIGTANGSSSVDLPETTSFAGFSCSGTVTGISVSPAYYFPLDR